MIIKKFSIMVSLLALSISTLSSKPEIKIQMNPVKIPKGVKYIKSSDAVNNKAAEKIKRLCFPEKIKPEDAPDVLLAGPRLWQTIKGINQISDKPSITVHIKVPINNKITDIEAGAIRFKERTYNFLYAFQGIIEKSKKAVVRKASENELSYYWMLISYDIEEPLLVLELDDTKYLIDFSEKHEFFYIEEVTGI